MDEIKIQVGGLTALNKGLKAIDAGAPKQLRLALNSAANMLVDKAKPGIPAVTGAARGSVKAASTRTSARVKAGGARAPHFAWLDFGGEGKRRGRPPARTFIPGGRYIYPVLADIRPQIEAELNASIRAVIADAGLEEG
jgi:hypothetical protein